MIKGLQTARGIAAVLVVLHHISLSSVTFFKQNAFGNFFDFGSIGVDFFFVLSGFIIYWVNSDTRKNTVITYIKKRVIRIYPPYLLISLLMLLVFLLFPTLSVNDRKIGIISSVLLIPTPPYQPALSIAWTLMHEMLFYIFFCTIFLGKRVFFACLLIWMILIMSGEVFAYKGIYKTFFFNPHNLQFGAGVLGALLARKYKPGIGLLIIGLLLLCFYIYFDFNYSINDYSALIKSYLGLTFMLIILGMLFIERRIIYPKFFLQLGAASYSLYLIHGPVISVMSRVINKLFGQDTLNINLVFIFILIICIFAGFIYYLIWEKPTLEYLKKKFV